MGYCPDNCIDWQLVGNPTGGCNLDTFRKRTLSRIAFMPCNVDLPDPFTAQNTLGLFQPVGDAVIVMSSPLANVVVNDPETEEITVHDCIPAQKVVNRRVITFEDRIKIEIPAITVPDAVPANLFYDYDFWKDKKTKRLLLRYGLAYCNGDFVFARNADGTLMEAWFDIFLAYQKLSNNGGTLELKKGSIEFQGDPLDFVKPDFNLNEFGITV
jgi:hypothetical protein